MHANKTVYVLLLYKSSWPSYEVFTKWKKILQKKPLIMKLKLRHLLFVFFLVSWEVFAGALCSGMPWFVSG